MGVDDIDQLDERMVLRGVEPYVDSSERAKLFESTEHGGRVGACLEHRQDVVEDVNERGWVADLDGRTSEEPVHRNRSRAYASRGVSEPASYALLRGLNVPKRPGVRPLVGEAGQVRGRAGALDAVGVAHSNPMCGGSEVVTRFGHVQYILEDEASVENAQLDAADTLYLDVSDTVRIVKADCGGMTVAIARPDINADGGQGDMACVQKTWRVDDLQPITADYRTTQTGTGANLITETRQFASPSCNGDLGDP